MQLHNYCPHPLDLRGYVPEADGTLDYKLPSEGNARVSQQSGECVDEAPLGTAGCIAIYGPSAYGAVTGLPEPQEGHAYVVSMMVAQALPDRTDLLVPGTGPADEAIRQDGHIVAVTRLIAPNHREA